MIDGVPDVDVAHVQRSQPEAADVRRAEVADHAALDQRTDDSISVLVREGHLRTPPRGIARRGELEAHARAALLDQLDEQLTECDRLGARGGHVHLEPEVDRRLERGELDDGRRPGDHRPDARGSAELGLEREGLGMAEPAWDGVAELAVQATAHVQQRRCSGTTVEVLVPATHGHVGTVRVDLQGNRRDAVAEVPERQRAGVARRRAERAHVVHVAGAVVDVGEHQHRDLVIQGIEQLHPGHHLHRAATEPCGGSGDIEIGVEVLRLGEDDGAARPHGERRAHQFEDAHRRALSDDHLIGARTDHPGQLGADTLGRLGPPRIEPAADQPVAPLAGHRVGDAARSARRQRTQRVAVQVDHPIGDDELFAHRRQRISCVTGCAGGPVDGGDHRWLRTSHSSGKKRLSSVDCR